MKNAMPSATDTTVLWSLTAKIVVAHLAGSKVSSDELPDLVGHVYRSLAKATANGASASSHAPSVPVAKSVTPDYLICLEDGRKFKSMKRHLRNAHNLTPVEYRKRWNLPANYPTVAPNYVKRRSVIAKELGFGQKRAARASRK